MPEQAPTNGRRARWTGALIREWGSQDDSGSVTAISESPPQSVRVGAPETGVVLDGLYAHRPPPAIEGRVVMAVLLLAANASLVVEMSSPAPAPLQLIGPGAVSDLLLGGAGVRAASRTAGPPRSAWCLPWSDA